MKCFKCGATNPARARFCLSCGQAFQFAETPEAPPTLNPAPALTHNAGWEVLTRKPAPSNLWFLPIAWFLLGLTLMAYAYHVFQPVLLVTLALMAVLVYADARTLGFARLRLARLKLSGTERTGPGIWALATFVFALVMLPWYMLVRRRHAALAAQALGAGSFRDRAEVKQATAQAADLPRHALLR